MKKSEIEDFAKNRLSSDILWYQAILNRFNSAQSANNSIDTKVSVLIAGMIAVGVYVASLNGNWNLYLIVGSLCLIVGIAVALKSIHIRDVPTEVHTTQEMEEYYADSNVVFTWKLINEVEEALKEAEKVNGSKSKNYITVVYFFLIASILIIIGQFVQSSSEERGAKWETQIHRSHHDR